MRIHRSTAGSGPLTLASLAILLLWDAVGLDMALARRMGGSAGFALRHDWWLSEFLHAGARDAVWLLGVALCLAVVRPVGPLRRLPFERRLRLALGALLASAAVALLKSSSQAICPYDLSAFGGLARYRPHWSGWTSPDGGPGRCFPAGHASAGFALVAGWHALRRHLPSLARAWLAAALLAGLGLGVAQQLRGTRFMSHTLWTGWICRATGGLVDLAATRFAANGDEAAP